MEMMSYFQMRSSEGDTSDNDETGNNIDATENARGGDVRQR